MIFELLIALGLGIGWFGGSLLGWAIDKSPRGLFNWRIFTTPTTYRTWVIDQSQSIKSLTPNYFHIHELEVDTYGEILTVQDWQGNTLVGERGDGLSKTLNAPQPKSIKYQPKQMAYKLTTKKGDGWPVCEWHGMYTPPASLGCPDCAEIESIEVTHREKFEAIDRLVARGWGYCITCDVFTPPHRDFFNMKCRQCKRHL